MKSPPEWWKVGECCRTFPHADQRLVRLRPGNGLPTLDAGNLLDASESESAPAGYPGAVSGRFRRKRSSLIGGIRYYDTVVDDARHTMTVARTAAHYGAVVRTSTQVVALLREGDRVTGVRVRDSENGAVTEVRGHVVVNATGVWTDEIQALSKQRGRFRVRASKGVHIVVPRDRIVSEVAIILRTEKSVLFVIPWGTHWIIGTTDTDWNLDLAHPGRHQGRHRLHPRHASTPCWPRR